MFAARTDLAQGCSAPHADIAAGIIALQALERANYVFYGAAVVGRLRARLNHRPAGHFLGLRLKLF
jgi:hypothetical protein